MGYLCAIFVILLGFIKKKSRIVTVIMAVYSWALIALNTYTADFAAYEEMYLCSFEARYATHEPGFMLLCKLFLRLGMTYRQFRMIIAGLIVGLLVIGLRRYTKNVNFALSLLLIFPFVGWASGPRYSMSVAIMTYSSRFLLSDRKGSLIKYILGIMVAVTFHYSAVFYLIFVFVKVRKIGTDFLLAIAIAIIMIVGVLFNTGILYKIGIVFTKSEKVLNWLEFRGGFSFLYILSLMLFACLIFILYRTMTIVHIRERKITGDNSLTAKNIDRIMRITILSLISFACAMFSSVVFLRLAIAVLPLCYAALGELVTSSPIDSIETKHEIILWELCLPIFCLFVLFFVYGYWIGGNMIQVYQNNLLFSWI